MQNAHKEMRGNKRIELEDSRRKRNRETNPRKVGLKKDDKQKAKVKSNNRKEENYSTFLPPRSTTYPKKRNKDKDGRLLSIINTAIIHHALRQRLIDTG